MVRIRDVFMKNYFPPWSFVVFVVFGLMLEWLASTPQARDGGRETGKEGG
jgi:hypothetical protein